MEGTAFIVPMQIWEIGQRDGIQAEKSQTFEPTGLFRDVLSNTVRQVQVTQMDVENKQYLLATGQLEDAHSLPIAEAKASLSLDLLISLRNKAMESYNELMKMSV